MSQLIDTNMSDNQCSYFPNYCHNIGVCVWVGGWVGV
jgi:hypothetical protein